MRAAALFMLPEPSWLFRGTGLPLKGLAFRHLSVSASLSPPNPPSSIHCSLVYTKQPFVLGATGAALF